MQTENVKVWLFSERTLSESLARAVQAGMPPAHQAVIVEFLTKHVEHREYPVAPAQEQGRG